jgi:protein-tyrosine phosphatase
MLTCAYGPPSRITDGLYQSGYPLGNLRRAGFGALALCAAEFQPSPSRFPGVLVVSAPMHDHTLDTPTLEQAERAAEQVCEALLERQPTLITCAMGKNRSGLVTGLVLVRFYGLSGREAVRLIRHKRPGALTNESFADYLWGL